MKIKRPERLTYTDDFIQQIGTLYQQGKTRSELALQYQLTPSALDRWITQYSTTGLLKTKDNRSTEDNAVAEATFNTIKTEFVKNEIFTNNNELRQSFSAYAYWYNNSRLHSSLGYLTPMAFNKQLPLNFVV